MATFLAGFWRAPQHGENGPVTERLEVYGRTTRAAEREAKRIARERDWRYMKLEGVVRD